MNAVLLYLRSNWKTNLVALVSAIYSADQFIAAVKAWTNHEPANWRSAIISLIVAIGMAVAKDGSNHSTLDQVQAATERAKLKS